MVGQLFGKTASIRSLARTTYLSSEHEWTYGKLRNAILHRKGYSFLEEEDHLSQSLVAISLTVIDYLLFKSLSWSPWFSWINAWPFLLLLFLRTFISSVSLSIISERERRSDRYRRLSTFCIFHAAGHSTICRSKSYYIMSTDLA